MITIDILDRNYAKKLFNGLSSGYKSSTVTDNADGSKTLTITFVNGDKANITFNPVKGDKGEQGLQGDKGDKGDKGDTGLGIKTIEQTTESLFDGGENILTITLTDGTSKSFKILNGSKGSKGDTGISLDDVKLVKDITDKTNHLQVKFDNETSYTDLGRVQGKSNYEIALDNGFVGNEDEYLKSLTAQATESKIVTSKPRIEDDETALGVWYYWQDNKEGTTDTAYKYRLDIPATQDLEHGKYCFYYNLKWFTSETTQDVNALTNKDTYKYYLVMNILDVCYDVIQETIADGTTTVLEHVKGDISTTTPASEYTPISSSALSMLGVQCQTLYIGATKETANEVTIRTGTDVKDFITSGSFQSIIGNKSDLSTLNNDNIVSAINEVKSDLDEHTNDTDIHTSATEKASYVKKTDIVDNLTSTDTDKPLSANQGKILNDKKVDKTDITTTINSTSTDTQVPTAKSVWDNMKNKNTMQPSGTMAKYSTVFDWAVNNAGATCLYEGNNLADCPLKNTWGTLVCIGIKTENGLKVLACSNFNDNIYIRTILRRNGTNEWVEPKWQKLCSTSVDDVPITYINKFENETYVKPNDTNVCSYYVTNGHCIIRLETVCLSTTKNFVQLVSGLPKPKDGLFSNVIDRQMESNSGARGIFHLLPSGILRVVCNYGNSSVTEPRKFYATFSYPVAES